jgi:hypothetical protein
MLSPHELELLTARVDGELTRRQRRELNRLLDRSGEARELLRRLEDDSRRLRQLPARTAPADLSTAVLDRSARIKGRPHPRLRPATAAVSYPVWVGLVLAASVLLVVGLTAFLVESGEPDPGQARLAQGKPTKKLPRRSPRDAGAPENDGDAEDEAPVDPPTPPEGPKGNGTPATPSPAPDRIHPPREVGPERDRTVLASGENEPFRRFERVELSLPRVWKIHELDRGDSPTKFLGELRAAAGVRVELLARDATRGFERLRAALQERKVQLTFDPAVLPRLKKPLWKTDYAVFVENLTPEDLAGALQAAGVADRQAGEKKPGETRFDGPVIVKDLARLDRSELAGLLGVDPVASRPARPALDGKGTATPAAAPEPIGYVTLLAGSRNKPAELKHFLESRRPAHPGTTRVFLVVRQVGG